MKVLPAACEAQGRPTPGQRQHNDLPCICMREPEHAGDHECRCGTHWANKPTRGLVDLVERATVVEIQSGDLLLFEVNAAMSDAEMAAFEEALRNHIARDVRVAVVEHARFAAVIRHTAGDATAGTVETTSFSDLAKGQRTYIAGVEQPR